MPDVVLSSDMDAFLTTANDAAARAELGLGSIATSAATDFARQYVLYITADVSAPSTSVVTSSESVTLPAGTYRFQGIIVARTASTTGGFNTSFQPDLTNVDYTSGIIQTGVATAEGGGGSLTPASRSGSNMFTNIVYCNQGASASNRFGMATVDGGVTFSSQVVITGRVSQAVTDGTNPALMKRGSWICFTRVN